MTGKRIGYIRVSTVDQNPDRQLEGIQLDKKFIEYASGTTIKRPQLQAMLDYIRDDDIVYVHAMDRMARNTRDLLKLVDVIVSKHASLKIVQQNLTFDGNQSPMSNLMLMIMGAIAEFEHALIKERQMEGILIAKKQGKYLGGHSKYTPEIVEKIKLAMQTRNTKSQIAMDLNISLPTLYDYLKRIENARNIGS